MHPAIAQHRSGISAICQRYRIHRLEVFGSAARADDFDPEHSDADFLVEFAPDVQPGLDSLFGAKPC
jgi:predicted nucleotidyltransferase